MHSKVYNHTFNAFPKNVGVNNGISPARPDMVEGLNREEFDPFPVRQQLGGAAVLSSGPHATTLHTTFGRRMGREELKQKWSASQQYIYEEDDEDDYDHQVDRENEPSKQLLAQLYASFTRDMDKDKDKGEGEGEGEDESLLQIPPPYVSSSASKRRGRR